MVSVTHQMTVRSRLPAPSPERAQAVTRGLEQMSGRNVEMELRIDPSIIGGVVARIGSTVYDASVATQLQKMRQRLVENV